MCTYKLHFSPEGGQVVYLVELLGLHSVFGINLLSDLDGSLLLHLLQLFVESAGTLKHNYLFFP